MATPGSVTRDSDGIWTINSREAKKLKQRTIAEFLRADRTSSVDIKRKTKNVYAILCVSGSTIKRSVRRWKVVHQNLELEVHDHPREMSLCSAATVAVRHDVLRYRKV